MKTKPEPIVKTIQRSRLRWFMHELREAGIPFDVNNDDGQYKLRIADPRGIETYNRIYGYKAKGAAHHAGGGLSGLFDGLRRKSRKQRRSR